MDNRNSNSGIRDVARNYNESLFRGRRWDNERAKQADAMGDLKRDEHHGPDTWELNWDESDAHMMQQPIPNTRPLFKMNPDYVPWNYGDPYDTERTIPNRPIQPENPWQIPYNDSPYGPVYGWILEGDPERGWEGVLGEREKGQGYNIDPKHLHEMFPELWRGWRGGVNPPGIIV